MAASNGDAQLLKKQRVEKGLTKLFPVRRQYPLRRPLRPGRNTSALRRVRLFWAGPSAARADGRPASKEEGGMLTLYSYPSLFGVADNNGYGLKVYAFLKLAGVPFTHQHIFDASAAPRGQLPYITDDGEAVGDSDTIITHVIRKYRVTMDDGLSSGQRGVSHMVTRMLDDLYWVMSYSRWKDERFCPAFIAAFRREHPAVTQEGLLKAKEFNAQRYHYQGIGRYSPEAAYARGLADLAVLANLLPDSGYLHGPAPTSIDAGIYGFIANIFYYEIDTPLREFVLAHRNLVRHCEAIHAAVAAAA
jgi:glutathione S-transferase